MAFGFSIYLAPETSRLSISDVTMKQDQSATPVSPEYLELRLALFVGERDLELRRRSLAKQLPSQNGQQQQQQQQPRSKQQQQQQRTHSCKYPSGSRRVSHGSAAATGQRSRRNGSPGTADRSPNRGAGDVLERDRTAAASSTTTGSPRSLSAPQSRSSSWKKMRRPRDVRHFREVYGGAEAGGGGGETLEETIVSKLHELKLLQDDDCRVVRSFSTSPRGIINRGDSFKRKSSPAGVLSSLPVAVPDFATSGDVLLLPVHHHHHQRALSSDFGDEEDAGYDVTDPFPTDHFVSGQDQHLPSYTVLVMGDHGVGKTALLQQFMTSEFMAAIETTFGELLRPLQVAL